MGDVEEGHRQNQWPRLRCRKDGEVSGCWAMSLQEIAAPTILVFQLSHLGQLSNAAEHWPRRLILSHQRIARDDCEPSHVREARWSSHSST